MKSLLILFIFFAPIVALSQSHPDNITYYLDSASIDWGKVYLDPANIKSMEVYKTGNGGSIYITTNNHVRYLTLEEILKQRLGITDDNRSILYIIEDKIILDKAGILIDSSFVKGVERINVSEASYINENLQSLTIIKIDLATGGGKNEIRIRGAATY